jgi:hypothetical protein
MLESQKKQTRNASRKKMDGNKKNSDATTPRAEPG